MSRPGASLETPTIVTILHFNPRYITAKVYLNTTDRCFNLTGLYRKPKVGCRIEFWNFFKIVHNNLYLPWVVLGDLNQILNPHDKTGELLQIFILSLI